jgi:hypothetical protein
MLSRARITTRHNPSLRDLVDGQANGRSERRYAGERGISTVIFQLGLG